MKMADARYQPHDLAKCMEVWPQENGWGKTVKNIIHMRKRLFFMGR